MRDFGDAQHQTHLAFHSGSPCPYRVVAEILAGRPDPRDEVAVWHIPIPEYDKPPFSLNTHTTSRGAIAGMARERDALKARTRSAVRDAGVPVLPHVHVELHWQPGRNLAHRDADNCVATLKYMIDALHHPDPASQWQPIVPGDDAEYVSWSAPILHPAAKGEPGRIWLMLSCYIDTWVSA